MNAAAASSNGGALPPRALPRRSTALLLLAALPLASSWAVGLNSPTDALDLDSLLLRWSSGVNTSYSSGLKGGIAWAFDPALCDRLVPLFPEEERARSGFYGLWQHLMPSLLRCEHLKATIRTSMRSWEAANTNIRFFEVSSLCDRAWQTPGSEPNPSMPPYAPPAPPPVTSPSLPPYSPPQPPLVPPSPPSEPPSPPQPPSIPYNATNGTFGWGSYEKLQYYTPGTATPCDAASISCIFCPFAELIISGFDLTARSDYTEADRLGHDNAARSPVNLWHRDLEVPFIPAADYQPGSWLRGDYTTGVWEGGEPPYVETQGRAVHSATIEFDVGGDRCWWHEDDICSVLFDMQAGNDADIYALLVSFNSIFFAIGIIFFAIVGLQRLYVIFQLTALAWDTDGDGVVEFHEVVQAMKIIFGGWILRMRDRIKRKKVKGDDAAEDRMKRIEWKSAIYGLFYSIENVNTIQALLLFILLFVPPQVREERRLHMHACMHAKRLPSHSNSPPSLFSLSLLSSHSSSRSFSSRAMSAPTSRSPSYSSLASYSAYRTTRDPRSRHPSHLIPEPHRRQWRRMPHQARQTHPSTHRPRRRALTSPPTIRWAPSSSSSRTVRWATTAHIRTTTSIRFRTIPDSHKRQ